MASCNRLRRLVAQICAAESATEPDPPLGSLEGDSPRLRAWTVAEILASKVELRQPGVFPSALPDGHLAVAQFRQFGYVVITDAVAPESLSQAQATFRAKQPFAKQVAALRQAEPRLGHPADVSMRYYDLPREDMDLADSDTLNGSHGSFLVTRQESDFDSYMGVLANPRVLPLLPYRSLELPALCGFTRNPLWSAHAMRCLEPEACAALVAAAECHAASCGGWSAARHHDSFPTMDFEVSE